MPHLGYLALTGANPSRQTPIPIWMHRGCTPFISKEHFERIYWPTLKPIVEALWAQGNQTLFYAEGKWDAHLESFAELPAHSIVYHLDRGNPERTHEVLGKKFCLSGGLPNVMLAFSKPEEVRAQCRKLIESIGAEGGYIMDASAILQNDATLENLRAMTEATRDYGVYRSPSSPTPAVAEARETTAETTAGVPSWISAAAPRPGVCRAWAEKVRELPPIKGDEALAKRVWEDVEGLAYLYIWHVLLSF